MISAAHGGAVELRVLRNRFRLTSRGATLADIVRLAAGLDMAARPISLDLPALARVELPCVLHWEFNHFVTLVQVRGNTVVIHDPAIGRRVVGREELSRAFTGVAIEILPTTRFLPSKVTRPISFGRLIGDKSVYFRPLMHAVLLSAGIQALVIVLPMGLQIALDRVADGDAGMFVPVLGVGIAGVVLIQSIATIARGLVLSYLGTTLHYRMMLNLFRHLIHLPASFFAKRSLADVISRFDSLRYIQRLLSQGFLEAAVDGAMTSLIAVVLFLYSPALAAVIALGVALYWLARHLMYDWLYQRQQDVIVRTANFQSNFMETVRGIVAIKLANRTHIREASWSNLVVSALQATHESNRGLAMVSGLSGLTTGLLWVATILMGSKALQSGSMTLGMVVAFVAWQQLAVSRAILLVDKVSEFRMLHLHRGRVADISEEQVDLEPEPLDASIAVKGRVELKDVSFRFDDACPWLLNRASMLIEPGEFVAIVAPSGQGKTTLIKLMLGLLRPSSGEIQVDGVELGRYGVSAFRESAGVVMQDDILFAGSILENIAFFEPRIDIERVHKAARIASLHDDVLAMPMAYCTMVGDMGAALSGGQRQRILLARAIYRNPSVLFLDEATSHLDGARESAVNAAVSKLNLTRIIVAHRLETIAAADRVISLTDGKLVAEAGSAYESARVAAPSGCEVNR